METRTEVPSPTPTPTSPTLVNTGLSLINSCTGTISQPTSLVEADAATGSLHSRPLQDNNIFEYFSNVADYSIAQLAGLAENSMNINPSSPSFFTLGELLATNFTAYAFFVQTYREEYKKKYPEEVFVFDDFSKKCTERWKTMSDTEKHYFYEMAEKEKARDQRRLKMKLVKDVNAPVRGLSAFFLFCDVERPKIRSQYPKYGISDIAKTLGKRWADADSETKSKYEAMAAKDKERYEKEMAAYKNSVPVLSPIYVDKDNNEDEEVLVVYDAEDD